MGLSGRELMMREWLEGGREGGREREIVGKERGEEERREETGGIERLREGGRNKRYSGVNLGCTYMYTYMYMYKVWSNNSSVIYCRE